MPADLFRGVRWSTCHAMADTLASLAPRSVGIGPTLADVDSVTDLATAERGHP